MRPGRLALLVVVGLLLNASASVAARDFDHPASSDTSQQFSSGNVQRQDTPNDPDYDKAEPGDPDSTTATPPGSVAPSSNIYDERFDLFGFPSANTPLAVYVEGPHAGSPMVSGFNAAGAWKLTRGRPDVGIAILDTGIKWDRASLRTKIRLNRAELPVPRHDRAVAASDGVACATYADAYDANGDGAFNVVDYACDSRVDPAAGPHGAPKLVDAEDLIAAFSDGSDADSDGYVDDIAGWDFFDDDNDPWDASSYFAAKNHGSGRASDAAEQANEGQGSLGVCPRCQILPVRIWDTFVSDGNTFAMGIAFATDSGVQVIEGANGSVTHSAFSEAASQYAYAHGVVQTYSGDDLNTGNHNFPANYDHTMLIQGTAPDAVGLGINASNPLTQGLQGLGVTVGTNIPVKTYFRGANTTQYGGHSSVAMEGATGSENTGKAAGAAGLVISAALDKGVTLRPDETREILEQTAEDVTGGPTGVDGNVAGVGLPDLAQPGWDPHFGWGRVNLGDAVSVAASGKLPPEAAIGPPDWFAPLTGKQLDVTGIARARFAAGGAIHWKLEWGPGLAPTSWSTAAQGDANGSVTNFGSIDLDTVRAALAGFTVPVDPGMPTFAPTNNPYQQQFAVRLVVTGKDIPTPGVDRKVFTAFTDPTLRPGFPKRMGTGGEAPLRYADINGDNVEELLLPLENGTLHAYEPDGKELDGWPVQTQPMFQGVAHPAAPGFKELGAPLEELRAPTVADLDDDGEPEVISTAGLHVYVWEPDGKPREGFPVSIDRALCRPEDQSQPLHHRKCGFSASTAVGRLQGAKRPLDVVASALDGHVYAFDGDGKELPGFPVNLADPAQGKDKQVLAESINEPAIGDLNGDGRDDIVAPTNEVYGAVAPAPEDLPGLTSQLLADLLGQVTNTSTRVYAIDGATGKYLPGWPIKLNGIIQATLPFIGPGQDPAIVKVGASTQIVVSSTGGALSEYGVDGSLTRGMQQAVVATGSSTDKTPGLNLFESASVGDLLGTGTPNIVKYQATLPAALNLLLVGQNLPWQHLIGAFDASTGVSLPTFPVTTDDYQFLSASNVAKLDATSATNTNQVLAGTGLGLLHAYDGLTGLDIAGFPKQTGGWLFSPAAVSADRRLADITREGYLFEWNTSAPRCQSEWPSFRHDPQGSGNYNRDGTAPGAPPKLAVKLHDNGVALTFDAPGDDLLCGTAASYQVVRSDVPITPRNFAGRDAVSGAPRPVAAGGKQEVALSARDATSRYIGLRAVDEVGNLGPMTEIDLARGVIVVGPGAEKIGGASGSGGRGQGVCASAAGFRAASVLPRGRRLRFSFARRLRNPVTIDVFQESRGRRVLRERLVARFSGRTGPMTWSGRANRRGRSVGDGYYFVRYRLRSLGGVSDVRRFVLRRVHGRFHVRPPFYRREECGVLSRFKLLRPVFGGRANRPLGISYRLARAGRVGVTVMSGTRVVRRYAVHSARRHRTYRLHLSSRGLPRGDYRFGLVVRAGSARVTSTLTSHRL